MGQHCHNTVRASHTHFYRKFRNSIIKPVTEKGSVSPHSGSNGRSRESLKTYTDVTDHALEAKIQKACI